MIMDNFMSCVQVSASGSEGPSELAEAVFEVMANTEEGANLNESHMVKVVGQARRVSGCQQTVHKWFR